MSKLQKLALTEDFFIYSVYQTYIARKKNNHFNSHLRYTPFLENNWSLPEKINYLSLKSEIKAILMHHHAVIPNYKKLQTIDLENISWFSHSIAALFFDLEVLVSSYTGNALPFLRQSIIPSLSTHAAINLAIKNKAIEDEDIYSQELWTLIFSALKEIFPAYLDIIALYVMWRYIKKPELKVKVDWHEKPPCGDLYKNEFKNLFIRHRSYS